MNQRILFTIGILIGSIGGVMLTALLSASKVGDMSYMFFSADEFNQPLNDWNVSKVKTTLDMFGFAENFNLPLDRWKLGKEINVL